MAWKKQIITIVRTLTGDLDTPYLYSDNRLLQTIVVAAQYVQFDVNLNTKYTLNLITPNITPDPSDNADDIFISLVGLKTAFIIDQSTFRTKASLEGIKAALGYASLNVVGSLGGWKIILDQGACKLYAELTDHWDIANANAVRAIFSPFVGNNFDPQNLSTPTNDFNRFQGNEYY